MRGLRHGCRNQELLKPRSSQETTSTFMLFERLGRTKGRRAARIAAGRPVPRAGGRDREATESSLLLEIIHFLNIALVSALAFTVAVPLAV